MIPAVSSKTIPNNTQVVITGVSGDTVKVITLSEWKKKKKSKENKRKEQKVSRKK